jgi:carboxymethylenebutenolidase
MGLIEGGGRIVSHNVRRFGWRLALAVSLAVAVAAKEAAAQGVETSTVEFRGGAGPIKGFLAKPKGNGPFPAIVVVHEWWGLSDWIKQNAERLASEGYVALAVDLYRGKVTSNPGEAHELMRALDPTEVVADLKGGVAYLKTLPFVAKDRKLGAIGWCMGGGYARLLSQASDAIGPTVICYGSVTTDPDQVAKLEGKPVLGIFGAEDRSIPANKVEEYAKMLRAKGAPAQIRIFDRAGHGFMRPGDQHNPRATAEAWGLIDRFFATNLKS